MRGVIPVVFLLQVKFFYVMVEFLTSSFIFIIKSKITYTKIQTDMEQKQEKWKVIPGYPRYMISDQGRVMSFTSRQHPEGKIMKQTKTKGGYMTVHLVPGTERAPGQEGRTLHVHRLLAEAFIPVPHRLRRKGKESLEVDHIIPLSNNGKMELSNLRWVTKQENMKNEMTLKNLEKANLEKSKTVYVYDEGLNLLSAFTSTAEASRQLGKSQGNITNCATGALRRYLGLIFSYVQLTDIKQREELEESRSEQRRKNMDSTLAACHRYYEKNKEAYNEYQRAYYWRDPDKHRKRAHEWYLTHKEEILKKKHDEWFEQKDKRGQADIPA